MERLKFEITDELKSEIMAEANRLWPNSGMMAMRRLVRDSLKRLWRYCNGKSRAKRRGG
jgi:hypothetical protein